MSSCLVSVLHMKGGQDETSYAKNSENQRRFITMTIPMKEEAMRKVCKSLGEDEGKRIVIADLGCSTGPNALLVAGGLISIFDRVRREQDHLSKWMPEVQVFLNDLPGNDFNSIFSDLSSFQEKLRAELGFGCFVNGVPGSFYGRLFPSRTIHFAHSTYSLHWLSQVPKGVEWRKDMSEESEGEEYYKQFKTDFTTFLKCRSEEIVRGGSMVLTMVGRRNGTPRSLDWFCYYSYWLQVIIQMTSEGLIDKEKMETFNLPMYAPSIVEIEDAVSKEGSFMINESQFFGENEKHEEDEESMEVKILSVVRGVRSVFEPYILSHFGQGIPIDQLFQRYEKMVRVRAALDLTVIRSQTISVSLTKTKKTY